MNIGYRESRDAGWGKLAARDGHMLSPDDPIIVYTATDKATAERFLREGVNPANKAMNLARERYETAEAGAEFAPGRGVGGGLYVGYAPTGVDGYGSHTLAIRTTVGALAVPPEQAMLGSERVPATPALALLANDAMLNDTILPANIRAIGEPYRNILYGTEWDALRKSQK